MIIRVTIAKRIEQRLKWWQLIAGDWAGKSRCQLAGREVYFATRTINELAMISV